MRLTNSKGLFSFLIYLKEIIKKKKRKLIRFLERSKQSELKEKLCLTDFNEIIRQDLGITKGDTIIVHSSFGNMGANFSPEEAIECLKNIVGMTGNILMPYYPPGLSAEWLKSKTSFSVKDTPTSMGILAKVFSEQKGVRKSLHPIKSMAVWGQDQEKLIKTHFLSNTPFDKKSPYYLTFLLKHSKTVGIGIEKNAFLHCCEDLNLDKADQGELYLKEPFSVTCIDYDNNEKIVTTFAHNPVVVSKLIPPCEFLKKYSCPTYKVVHRKGRLFYTVENNKVMKTCVGLFNKGISRVTTK